MIDFEKILTAKGKTKADLARFLEIEPNNVNRTIRNERIPLSKIESICEWGSAGIKDVAVNNFYYYITQMIAVKGYHSTLNGYHLCYIVVEIIHSHILDAGATPDRKSVV